MVDIEIPGYETLACPSCHFITYVKPDQPKTCYACNVDLKSCDEATRLIIEEHAARNS